MGHKTIIQRQIPRRNTNQMWSVGWCKWTLFRFPLSFVLFKLLVPFHTWQNNVFIVWTNRTVNKPTSWHYFFLHFLLLYFRFSASASGFLFNLRYLLLFRYCRGLRGILLCRFRGFVHSHNRRRKFFFVNFRFVHFRLRSYGGTFVLGRCQTDILGSLYYTLHQLNSSTCNSNDFKEFYTPLGWFTLVWRRQCDVKSAQCTVDPLQY